MKWKLQKFTCLRCGRLRKIRCKGYCNSCYSTLKSDKERKKADFKKWLSNNPDYFKDYYLLHRQLRMDKVNGV